MLDWLGSVQIRKRTSTRVELDLTRATAWTGWGLAAGGVWLVDARPRCGRRSSACIVLVASAVCSGRCAASSCSIARTACCASSSASSAIRRRAAIPLFHLRAVVVAARRGGIYVAYVERRIGGTIHLDEARRPAPLLALAEAIAEVAELRLVYDATTRVAVTDSSDR